jgi:hypothetical protein
MNDSNIHGAGGGAAASSSSYYCSSSNSNKINNLGESISKSTTNSSSSQNQQQNPRFDRVRSDVIVELVDWIIHLSSLDNANRILASLNLSPLDDSVQSNADSMDIRKEYLSRLRNPHDCHLSNFPDDVVKAYVVKNFDYINLYAQHSDWSILQDIFPPSVRRTDEAYQLVERQIQMLHGHLLREDSIVPGQVVMNSEEDDGTSKSDVYGSTEKKFSKMLKKSEKTRRTSEERP